MEDLTLTLNLVVLSTVENREPSACLPPISRWPLQTTWKVLSKSLGSDHNTTQMNVNDKVLHEDLRKPRVNLKTLNWNSFQEMCLSSITQELPSETLEARLITDCIVEAARISSHNYKGQSKRGTRRGISISNIDQSRALRNTTEPRIVISWSSKTPRKTAGKNTASVLIPPRYHHTLEILWATLTKLKSSQDPLH